MGRSYKRLSEGARTGFSEFKRFGTVILTLRSASCDLFVEFSFIGQFAEWCVKILIAMVCNVVMPQVVCTSF